MSIVDDKIKDLVLSMENCYYEFKSELAKIEEVKNTKESLLVKRKILSVFNETIRERDNYRANYMSYIGRNEYHSDNSQKEEDSFDALITEYEKALKKEQYD